MSPPTLTLQASGTLAAGSLYIERPVDSQLGDALLAGEYCCVLAPRQTGKSSLCRHVMERLVGSGVQGVHVDLGCIGTNISNDAWFLGLTELIARDLLPELDILTCWQGYDPLPPVSRFLRFMAELLSSWPSRAVIFLDEIDALLVAPQRRDDFFAAVRELSNLRADDAEYQRISFCLVGVAAPSELIGDPRRTPFNIARMFYLQDFSDTELQALIPILAGFNPTPAALLAHIQRWTGGHPAMTLTLCKELGRRCPTADHAMEVLEQLVGEVYLTRGRVVFADIDRRFDLPELGARTTQQLALYRRVLASDPACAADYNDPIFLGLWLTGLIRATADGLRPRNQILATLFDTAWIRERDNARVLTGPLMEWMESGRRDDLLLRGAALARARVWVAGQRDLTADETGYLLASTAWERKEQEAEAGHRRAETAARRRRAGAWALAALSLILAVLISGSVWLLWNVQARQRHAEQQLAQRKAEWKKQRSAFDQQLALERGKDEQLSAQLQSVQQENQRLVGPRDQGAKKLQDAKFEALKLQAELAKIKTAYAEVETHETLLSSTRLYCGDEAHWAKLEKEYKKDTAAAALPKNRAAREEALALWNSQFLSRPFGWPAVSVETQLADAMRIPASLAKLENKYNLPSITPMEHLQSTSQLAESLRSISEGSKWSGDARQSFSDSSVPGNLFWILLGTLIIGTLIKISADEARDRRERLTKR